MHKKFEEVQWWMIAVLAACCLILLVVNGALAHMADRPDLNSWFNSLSSEGGGLCCSMVDGSVVSDVDWESKDGHYRVKLDGQWVDVPDNRVIKSPNRYGPAMVWPYKPNATAPAEVRCFMPGAGT